MDKKQILDLIGQENLKKYFDYCNQDVNDSIIEDIFDAFEISEDDIEEDDNNTYSELVEDEYAKAKGV